MPRAHAEIGIGAGPERVWQVLTDFAAWPTFLPAVQTAEVLSARPDAWEVRFGVQLIRPLHFTLHHSGVHARTLRWSLVEGTMRANEGSWELEPSDEGTRLSLRLDLQLGLYVPHTVLAALHTQVLPALLDGVRQRAEAGTGGGEA